MKTKAIKALALVFFAWMMMGADESGCDSWGADYGNGDPAPSSPVACTGAGGGGTGGSDVGEGGGLDDPGDPGERPEGFGWCTGLCAAQCPSLNIMVNGFSPSVWKFKTIVKDDGEGKGGGWQAATGVLQFYRWTTTVLPDSWTCTVSVGMPIRSMYWGTWSATLAAKVTASIATSSSLKVTNETPELAPGIFCLTLAKEMDAEFAMQYPNLGETVSVK